MKKKAAVIISVLLLCLLAAGAVLYLNSDGVKVRKQLDLGQKYLNELDYEQAIASYEAVLDIDKENVDAYLGIAEAYVGLEDYEGAVDILKTGYELTANEVIKGRIDEYQKVLDEIAAEEARKKAEEAKRKEEEQRRKERESFAVVLKPIYEAIISGNIEMAFEQMQGDAYISIASEYSNGEINQPYYNPENVDFEVMKNGIAIYMSNDIEGIQSFCYCGDFAGGIREGTGDWLCCASYEKESANAIYSGEMKNDLPNGNWQGHEWWENMPENSAYEMIREGEFIDGVGNGNYVEIAIYDGIAYEFALTLENGYGVPISEETNPDGTYRVAYDKTGNFELFMSPDDRRVIWGFEIIDF